MSKIQLVTLLTLFQCFTLTAQPCENGFSGLYPCDLIDQLAEITNAAFGPELENEQVANDIWGWTSEFTGREYAIMGMFERTVFVDISTPQHPIYLGYLPTATTGRLWRDIKVIDHWAYIVSEAGGHGMQVFDLRRLEALSFAEIPVQFDDDAYYTGFGNAHNIVADAESNYVYAVGSDTFAGGLHIIDVSDPLNPTYAGSSDEDGYTHDAQVVVYQGPHQAFQGKQICFAANENTITVLDVTNKTDVALLSRTGYEMVGYTHQCWLTDDHRFLIANDELDEIESGINTRTIIFNVEDLENPFVVGYVDLGTNSIDHNLYVHEGLLYLSNYTSGLRILSLKDVEQGALPPVGHFDVFPNGQPKIFHGSWSNYPYFESGIVVASNIYFGMHILKPRLFTLDQNVIEVCSGNSATLLFSINVPTDSEVTYSIEYDSGSGPNFFLEASSSPGAPFQNAAVFTGLSSMAPGFYSGAVVMSYEGYERRLPFVIALQQNDLTPAAELIEPVNGQVLGSQTVDFYWSHDLPGYSVLEISPDPDFETIIYREEIFAENGHHTVQVPFDQTYYYWRILKPLCGETSVSETGEFEVGLVTNTLFAEAQMQELRVYPNPAVSQITIQAPEQVRSVQIFDISGRALKRLDLGSGRAGRTFDVSDLSTGVYIIRNDSGMFAAKFVVQ